MACETIQLDSDNLIAFDDASDTGSTPAVDITGATVTAELIDITDPDAPVSILGPLAMPEHPSAPSNDYRVTYFADSGAGFYAGQRIRIQIDFDGGAGLRLIESLIALVVA